MSLNCKVRQKIEGNSNSNEKSVALYVNCGDPDLAITRSIICQVIDSGIDILELGVPFPDSFSDGETIKRSHSRALANMVDLSSVLDFVVDNKDILSIPIVLLVDYRHSVRPIGLPALAERCACAGIAAVLCHGLPPLFVREYVDSMALHGISPIFSLYPKSTPEKIHETIAIAKGFIYMASQYGKTGGAVDFQSSEILEFYKFVREKTGIPLLAGFGIKDESDLVSLFAHKEINGAIIGSTVSAIIERSISGSGVDQKLLTDGLAEFLQSVAKAKKVSHEEYSKGISV